MIMQSQRECSEIWRDSAKNNQEITAEVQETYPNFSQNLNGKENFVISKVGEIQPLLDKGRLRAARFQKLTTRMFSEEKGIWKQNILPKSRVFSENSIKTFFAQHQGPINTHEMPKLIKRHNFEAICQVLRVVVNHRKG